MNKLSLTLVLLPNLLVGETVPEALSIHPVAEKAIICTQQPSWAASYIHLEHDDAEYEYGKEGYLFSLHLKAELSPAGIAHVDDDTEDEEDYEEPDGENDSDITCLNTGFNGSMKDERGNVISISKITIGPQRSSKNSKRILPDKLIIYSDSGVPTGAYVILEGTLTFDYYSPQETATISATLKGVVTPIGDYTVKVARHSPGEDAEEEPALLIKATQNPDDIYLITDILIDGDSGFSIEVEEDNGTAWVNTDSIKKGSKIQLVLLKSPLKHSFTIKQKIKLFNK